MTDNELAMLYPIGMQSFSEIREGGYVYVDKTAAVFSLASTGEILFPEPSATLRKELYQSYLLATLVHQTSPSLYQSYLLATLVHQTSPPLYQKTLTQSL